MTTENLTISDVETGAANYMLGALQMTIAGNGSISPEQWQVAINDTVAFQRRMAGHSAGTPEVPKG